MTFSNGTVTFVYSVQYTHVPRYGLIQSLSSGSDAPPLKLHTRLMIEVRMRKKSLLKDCTINSLFIHSLQQTHTIFFFFLTLHAVCKFNLNRSTQTKERQESNKLFITPLVDGWQTASASPPCLMQQALTSRKDR